MIPYVIPKHAVSRAFPKTELAKLVVVILVVCSCAADVQAASDPRAEGLTDGEQSALTRARDRGDVISMRAIVIAAIASASDRSAEIVRTAIELIPTYASGIIADALKTFPALAERIRSVSVEAGIEPVKPPEEPKEKIVDVEQLPLEPEAPGEAAKPPPYGHWSGETTLGGTYKNDTQKSLSAYAQFKLTHENGKWTNTGSVSFDYGRTNNETVNQDILIKGRTRREINESIYGFGLASYEDKRFSGFDYQITEGVGIGYWLFDSEDFRWSLEGGPSVRQKRVTATGELNNELLLRLASLLEWNISDTAKFSNETALLLTKNSIEIETDAFGAVRDSSETTNISALDMQIIGNLAARLTYEFRFRTDPPTGGQSTESTARVSLVHSF